jgi:predicted metalloprotease with PDZ domain
MDMPLALAGSTLRDVTFTKSNEYKYFGFTARGSNPVFLNMVDPGGLADTLGAKEGDHILAINGVDSVRLSHKEVRGTALLPGSCFSRKSKEPRMCAVCKDVWSHHGTGS